MRRSTFLIIGPIIVVLCGSTAQASWITYDASLSTVPSAQGWTLFNFAGDPAYSQVVTDSGAPALRIDSTPDGLKYHIWRRNDMDFDFLQTGFTLEATLKMVQGHGTEAMLIGGTDRQGRKLGVRFHPEHTPSGGRIHIDAASATYVDFDATDDYHTYRFVVEPGTGLGSFFIDGDEKASGLAMKAPSATATYIFFGDGTSSAGGEAFFRSIAFLPIPEPGSTALLLAAGLAGLLAFGRRRRSWTSAGHAQSQ